jgi:hypothetical protein
VKATEEDYYFAHWREGDDEHELWRERVVAFRFDDVWYLLHRDRLQQKTGGCEVKLREALARRLRTRVEEIHCRPHVDNVLFLTMEEFFVEEFWDGELRVFYGRNQYLATIKNWTRLWKVSRKRVMDIDGR